MIQRVIAAVHFIWIPVVVMLGVTVSNATTDYTAGVTFLNERNYVEAEKKLAAAFKAHPSDLTIALTYARLAPCSLAIDIFSQCATNEKAPDSLRAAAYVQLGDYSFVHSAFKTAAERYRRAAALQSLSEYRHRWALAAAALDDMKTARSLWHTITLDRGTDLALEAQYHIGLLDMEELQYDSAFVRFDKVGKIDTTKSWTVAAAAAQLECAIKLEKKKTIAKLEKELKPFSDRLLERDLVKLASLRTEKKSSGVQNTKPAAPSNQATLYTLQVGAFGSLDNATNLQNKLSKRFGSVTILPVTLSDQVFYRVRIGSFDNKDEAEAFGTDSLTPAGISYKAVVK